MSQNWAAGSAGTSVCNSGGLCHCAFHWDRVPDAPAAGHGAATVPTAPLAPNIITLLKFYQSKGEKHTQYPRVALCNFSVRSVYLWVCWIKDLQLSIKSRFKTFGKFL